MIVIERETKSGWAKTATVNSFTKAGEVLAKSKRSLRAVAECGCILYEAAVGWEQCGTHARMGT